MDVQAFASLGQIRILLLPVGSIRKTVFEKWAKEISEFDQIRLLDVPVDSKDDRGRFMPNPLSAGYLHLSFSRHPPIKSQSALSVFRISQFPLGVVGIADYSHREDLTSSLSQFNSSFANQFLGASHLPLAQKCFAFEDVDGQSSSPPEDTPGVVFIPSVMGNKKLYIGTLLAELCSNILGELSVMLSTFESPSGIDLLNSSILPTFPPDEHTPSIGPLRPKFVLPIQSSQPELSVSSASQTRSSTTPVLKRILTEPGIGSDGVSKSHISSMSGPSKSRISGAGLPNSNGRFSKILGDCHLLAGRTIEAVSSYNEAIVSLRSHPDAIWLASALEGLATAGVLDAWSAAQGLNSSFSNAKEPWTEFAEELSQAVLLYSKASPSPDEGLQYTHLAFLYVTAVMRHAELLFSVWSAKGWGPLAFMTMLHPGPHPYLPPTITPAISQASFHLDRMSTISGIQRSEISTVLVQIHGPWLLHLGSRERIVVLEAAAGIFSCLGYRRKEAYIVREIVGCILDLIVCGREESDPTRYSALGFQDDSSLGTSQIGIRDNENTIGNDSILRLVRYVCETHGVNLSSVRHHPGSGANVIVPPSSTQESPMSSDVKLIGWPELQIGIVREALAVAEALPDYPAVALFSLSALKSLHHVLDAEDQYHLHITASRASATARRRGQEQVFDCWSGNPLVGIEMLPLPFGRLPIERPVSELQSLSQKGGFSLPGQTDPFLYNPRRLIGAKQAVVVQMETLEFVVTLQNPYCFTLELQAISLSTTGVPFESKEIPVAITSNSFHRVTLSGKALEVGVLVIRGCVIQAPDGVKQEFGLPISDDRGMNYIRATDGVINATVFDARPKKQYRKEEATLSRRLTPSPVRFMELKVVPEQPMLRIRRTSITHGALMLYNGETSTIRLTLENVSSIPVDFLKLTFYDSTKAHFEEALADDGVSVFESYEAGYNLIYRPAFWWEGGNKQTHIQPGKELVISICCRGKSGCTEGMVQISYSYLNGDGSAGEAFYTRQLLYPVQVTVYQMLECRAMDLIPHTRVKAINDGKHDDVAQMKALLQREDLGYSLFTIDVRNTYGIPFEVTFSHESEETETTSTSQIVSPGSTQRFILPLKRFLLPASVTSSPIPSLTDKQFVVGKANLSAEEESIQRELFWYREELFKRVKGRWREAAGSRHGELSLRGQRLTLPMLKALRTETVRIEIALNGHPDAGKQPDELVDAKYIVKPNDFVFLRSRVSNLSASSLALTLSLSLTPPEHVIYNGIVTNIPVGRVDSGLSKDLVTVLCFTAEGRYDITGQAWKSDGTLDRTWVGEGFVQIIAKAEHD